MAHPIREAMAPPCTARGCGVSALVTVLAVAGTLATAWAVPAGLAWALVHAAALIEQREARQ